MCVIFFSYQYRHSKYMRILEGEKGGRRGNQMTAGPLALPFFQSL